MGGGNRSFRPDRFRQQTQARLIVAGFLILIAVGGGIVWLIYGPSAALTAVSCILVVGGIGGLLWLILALLSLWVKDDEP
jgi:hypothetical protein